MDVLVRVTSDPGRSLSGASLVIRGRPIATTGAEGSARLSLEGAEGEIFEVTVRCPTGHRSPSQPLVVPLRRLADPRVVPEYEVTCPKTSRKVVVAVRADNGAGLPVTHLGKEIARTDDAGAATVLLDGLEIDDAFTLTLDTGAAPELRPQNPTHSFTVRAADTLLVLDQRFTVEKAKAAPKPPPPKVGPIALPTRGGR